MPGISSDAPKKGMVRPVPKMLLYYVGSICPDGDELAVGHIDYTHQAEGDGEADGDDKENGSGGHAPEESACRVDPGDVSLDPGHSEPSRFLKLIVARFLGFASDGFQQVEGWERSAAA